MEAHISLTQATCSFSWSLGGFQPCCAMTAWPAVTCGLSAALVCVPRAAQRRPVCLVDRPYLAKENIAELVLSPKYFRISLLMFCKYGFCFIGFLRFANFYILTSSKQTHLAEPRCIFIEYILRQHGQQAATPDVWNAPASPVTLWFASLRVPFPKIHPGLQAQPLTYSPGHKCSLHSFLSPP